MNGSLDIRFQRIIPHVELVSSLCDLAANDSPLRIEAFHYGELKYQEESKQDKSYSIPISAVTVDADATARTSKESQPAEACHNHSAESLFCVPSPFAVSHSGQQSNGTSPSNRKRNEVVCGPFSIVEEQKSETNTGANLTFSTQVTPLTTNRTPTWDATETDEDYAPIADYIGNSGVNKTIPTQKVKTLGNDVDIKWELVTSAYMGDDDYVPMSDYSSSNATGNYKSTKNENPEFLDMTYAGHRAAIRRKRKQRRRRLVRLIAAALLAIFLFFLKNALNFNRKAMVERQVLESTVTESICEAQFEGIFPLPESPIAEELESTLLLEVTEMVDHEEPNGSNHGTLSSLLCFVLLMCRSDGRNVWSIPDPQERRRIVEGILDTMFQ